METLQIAVEDLIKKTQVTTAGVIIQVTEVNPRVAIQEVITDLRLLHPGHLPQVTGAVHQVPEGVLQG